MNRTLAKACGALVLLGMGFQGGISAFAQAGTEQATLATLAADQGADRLQTLIAGAKKEGQLTVYESMAPEDMAVIANAFSKQYGIKVTTWRSGSEGVLQKVVTEARAGRFEVDVVENNAPELEALHREKLLQAIDSPRHKDLMPEAVPAHKEWTGSNVDVYVQAYNTQKVKKEELPKSFYDLLDPKWKGRLGLEAEDQHWFATLVAELGQEKGIQLFKDIVAANGISVRKGHSQLTNLTVSGEVPLSLTNYINKPGQLKQKGAPIESFIMSPAIAQFRGVSVLKKAPHPHAALLFYDFVLNEGQEILLKRNYVPSSTRIDTPIKEVTLKFIKPEHALDMNEQWTKLFDEVVVKRSK